MPENPKVAEFQRRLAQVESTVRRLRLEAFVDYTPVLFGFRLRPITLTTFIHLQAFKNAFLVGGAVTLKDIVQFVWIHHPDFGQFNRSERRRVVRQIARSLEPVLPTANAVARLVAPVACQSRWWALRQFARMAKCFIRPTAADLCNESAEEIRRLVHEALHDFPCGGDDEKAAPYAFKAGLVSLFQRGYSLDFRTALELVETLPLKQLMEFVREVIFRASKGKDKLLTADEASVWADWLDFKNELAEKKKEN